MAGKKKGKVKKGKKGSTKAKGKASKKEKKGKKKAEKVTMTPKRTAGVLILKELKNAHARINLMDRETLTEELGLGRLLVETKRDKIMEQEKKLLEAYVNRLVKVTKSDIDVFDIEEPEEEEVEEEEDTDEDEGDQDDDEDDDDDDDDEDEDEEDEDDE